MCLAGTRCHPGRESYQLREGVCPDTWAALVSGGGTLKILHLANMQTVVFIFLKIVTN